MPARPLPARFRRPTVPALLAAGLAFVVLAGFGVWQLQRLAWKNDLIRRYETARVLPPISLDEALAAPAGSEFRKIKLQGRYLPQEFHLAAQYHRGRLGYRILAPFAPHMHLREKEDQPILLVNRGWVPADRKQPQTRPESLPGEGSIAITGTLRSPMARRRFMPPNRPDDNLWFWEDMEAIGRRIGTPPLPFVLLATAEEPPSQGLVPHDGGFAFRNDHLGYAVTWFALAGVVLIMFLIYHHRPDANRIRTP